MNIAFSALLVLVLVLPGIALRYSYARGPWRWSHPTSLRPLADEVAYSVVSATGLHLSDPPPGPHRRKLSDDRTSADPSRSDEDRYYDIRGDFLVLRYSELKTLNLDYFEIEETGELAGADGPGAAPEPDGTPVPAAASGTVRPDWDAGAAPAP